MTYSQHAGQRWCPLTRSQCHHLGTGDGEKGAFDRFFRTYSYLTLCIMYASLSCLSAAGTLHALGGAPPLTHFLTTTFRQSVLAI